MPSFACKPKIVDVFRTVTIELHLTVASYAGPPTTSNRGHSGATFGVPPVILARLKRGSATKRTPKNPDPEAPHGPPGIPIGLASSASRRYMQRDVESEIETVDKSGGFIGALWLNKNENAVVALVLEGLATVHSHSADTLPWSKQLYAVEVCPVFYPPAYNRY